MFNNNYTKKPTRGLVASYPLDGNANASVGTNGTATNVTWVKTDKGYQSQCGSFNGSNSYINANGTSGFNYDTYTISGWIKQNATPTGSPTVIGKGSSGVNEPFTVGFNGSGQFELYLYGLANTINLGTLTNGVRYYFTFVWTYGGTGYGYLNSSLIDSNVVTSKTTNALNIFIGAFNNNGSATRFFNGTIQNVDIYNVALTEDEITTLYREGLRQLGNGGSYPGLLSGLVGYFRAEDVGGTALYNLANGITATRVGGTNTADNLGNNQAISNPNYTWSSLTYTTGYTFENSGSGWNIVTSPTGLSATGINRTTTLRDIFLFNRTLSANEVTQLQDLCNKEIIYTSKVYDLPNLRDGLVAEYNGSNNGTTWYDTSGNGNNGTGTAITMGRQGRIKTMGFNGSSSLISFGNVASTNFGTGDFTINAWFNLSGSGDRGIINKVNSADTNGFSMYISGGKLSFFTAGYRDIVGATTLSNGIRYMGTVVRRAGYLELYLNSKNDYGSSPSGLGPALNINNTYNLEIGRLRNDPVRCMNGPIGKTQIYNRALSQAEIQQLYYSQKANFIY